MHCLLFSLIGSSCRYKVLKWLKKSFETPQSAGVFYFHQSSTVGIQTDSTSTQSQSVQTEDPVPDDPPYENDLR